MEAEEQYTYKVVKPYAYTSNKRYRQSDQYLGMGNIMTLLISFLLGSVGLVLALCTSGVLAFIFCILTLILFTISIFIISYNVLYYDCSTLIRECKARYYFRKYKTYIPFKKGVIDEFNRVIQLKNGRMYRMYQFINAEQSSRQTITLQLPKDAQKVLSSHQTLCMFQALNDVEMAELLLPIRQYYVDKYYRDQLEQKEAVMQRQSEINRRVTSEDINNLPLFKSMASLVNKTEQSVQQYQKEMTYHYKDNQAIINQLQNK